MKICWDNLEKVRYDITNNCWYKIYKRCHSNKKQYRKYIYVENCKKCGEAFLAYFSHGNYNKFCSKSCSISFNTTGDKNTNYGKNLSTKTKLKISNSKKGKKLSKEDRLKLSLAHPKKEKSPMWRGGKDVSWYNTYAPQISYSEATRRDPDNYDWLQVKCAYCGKWYNPMRLSVRRRINALNGIGRGESRLYCSAECKKLCPTYLKRKYSAEETNTKQLSREVQPQLRQLVFERDNWICTKCGNDKSLTCHHKEGILWEPLMSADIDMCITYCKDCHKNVHKIDGCGYQDMRCI